MLDYHAKTMHSYLSVRTKSQGIDWDNQPKQFKIYPDTYRRITLDKDNSQYRFFSLIGGITAQKSYPGVSYALRTNPSAGALYPSEVYVQIRGVEDFVDGLYHLSPSESALVLLCSLAPNEGVEYSLHVNQIKGFIFLFSALYYRSSWKYKNRAFRYCLHDTGHMIGTLEASCLLVEKPYRIIYGGDKQRLNELLCFGRGELYLSSVIVGEEEGFTCKYFLMDIPPVDGTGTFEANALIEETYVQTSHPLGKKQMAMPYFDFEKEHFLKSIWQRRSIRELTQKSITQEAFDRIMHYITQPIPSDVDEEIQIYTVINRVVGMNQGVWENGSYIKMGDFTQKAGYLCLEQSLGSNSAVTFFLVGKSAQNYQPMMQKAGIIGHRLYLVSEYLGIGCSGIGAYYDAEVSDFLETKGMILYALAIGK